MPLIDMVTEAALRTGMLGIAVVGASDTSGQRARGIEEWSAPTFEVLSEQPVAAGIDGEAARLDPPLRFLTRPRVLRVRIAPQHPGASPSAAMPADPWHGFLAILRVAFQGSA